MKNKGIGKKVIMVTLIPVLVALGVYLGGNVVGMDVGMAREKEVKEETVVLEKFMLNLESTQLKKRYIRVEIALSTVKEKGLEEIEDKDTLIRDVIIRELSNKRVDSIYESGEDGFKIKEQLRESINKELGEDLISNVYISNMVVQ